MRTLNEMARMFNDNAHKKGFYKQIDELMDHPQLTREQKDFILSLWRSNRLMLIVSELAEGLEGLSHGNLSSVPKSGGLGEELADAQIRLADFALDIGMDLEVAILEKHKFNTLREYKHGNRQL